MDLAGPRGCLYKSPGREYSFGITKELSQEARCLYSHSRRAKWRSPRRLQKPRATLQQPARERPRNRKDDGLEAVTRNAAAKGIPYRLLKYLSNVPSPLMESNINPFRGQVDELFNGGGTGGFSDTVSHPVLGVKPPQTDDIDVYSFPLGMSLSHPTMQVLGDRLMNGSKPGGRSDGLKVGLVVEGGGMRGAVTGGMLMQLHDLGLKDLFDVVYGSSAGAINATYFLSGQGHGLDVYFDHLANANFMCFRRMFSKDPVMNLEYLLYDVMHERLPLDWNKVLESDIPLKVVASSLDALSAVVLEGFESKHDLAEALWASANVPEIAGPPRTVNGERLVDAAVFEPIPYRAAVRDGCTHVLALCSRPRAQASTRGAVKKLVKNLATLAIKRVVLNPPYMNAAWDAEFADTISNGGINLDDLLLLTMIEGFQGITPAIGGQVFPLYPPPNLGIPPTCLNTETLRQGAMEGREAINRLFHPMLRQGFPKHSSPEQHPPALGDRSASP